MAPIDKDSWLWQRGRVLGVAMLSMVVIGMVTSLIERPIWSSIQATQPELNLKDVEGALGQGLVIGLIGGFRTIIADFMFIRANTFWEKRDRPNTETMLNMVVAVDPRPMFFWLNGSRMMAYDMPNWEIRARGGYDAVPESVQDEINAEYAQLGMDFIDKAQKFHPDEHKIPLEKAQIYTNRLEDYANAARYYKEVIAFENAPFFTHRIYAEMLRRSGQADKAYDYLTQLYPTLSTDNPMAARDVVLERIRELEETLDIPLVRRFPIQPEEQIQQDFQINPLNSDSILGQ